VPFSQIGESELVEWADLHGRIVQAARLENEAGNLFGPRSGKQESLGSLLDELNKRVYRALRFRDFERALVRDLVHVRMTLIKGKVDPIAIRPPVDAEIQKYGIVLTDELDAFIDDQPSLKHSTLIAHDGRTAIIHVQLHKSSVSGERVRVLKVDSAAALDLMSIRELVRKKHSQWIYFERELRLYEGRNTYIVKPLERHHWTESQAYLDAGTIISETLT
jgi:hypothetical protein